MYSINTEHHANELGQFNVPWIMNRNDKHSNRRVKNKPNSASVRVKYAFLVRIRVGLLIWFWQTSKSDGVSSIMRVPFI